MRSSPSLLASFQQEFGIDPDAIDPADIDEDYSDPQPSPAPLLKGAPRKNPNLSNRLPREDFAICVSFDDRPPLMERCKEVLGDRMQEKRGKGFFLDGRPCNTDAIVEAAGLKFKDEEDPLPSEQPRRRKRRGKKTLP